MTPASRALREAATLRSFRTKLGGFWELPLSDQVLEALPSCRCS
jgi:hypothetical protein